MQRAASLPVVPTIAESGYPGFEALNWFGALARSGTPKNVLERLGAEMTRALQTPEVRGILAKQGLDADPLTLEAFDVYMKSEMQRNERIVEVPNLKNRVKGCTRKCRPKGAGRHKRAFDSLSLYGERADCSR